MKDKEEKVRIQKEKEERDKEIKRQDRE